MINLKPGEIAFICHGCHQIVRGPLVELRACLDVMNRTFCPQCRQEFRGVYNDRNVALGMIFTAIVHRKVIVKKDPDKQQDYAQEVRRLTELEFKRYQRGIDPKGLRTNGYDLDHIVPISWCWRYDVPAKQAAARANLAIIKKRINSMRKFEPHRVVGTPPDILEMLYKRLPRRDEPEMRESLLLEAQRNSYLT